MGNETNELLPGELFPQIIDFLPYPIAIFTPQYTLVMINKAFAKAVKMRFINAEKEPYASFSTRLMIRGWLKPSNVSLRETPSS